MIWVLCGYVWLFIHRPFEIWPWLGALHLERVYMIMTLLVWLVASPKQLIQNRVNGALCVFVVMVVISWLLSPYREIGTLAVENYLKIIVFYILVVTSVHSERDLQILAAAFLLATALYMGHSFYEYLCGRHVYRMGTARMVGVDATYSHSNSIAATLVLSLPLLAAFRNGTRLPLLPAWIEWRPHWMKRFTYGYLALAVLCVMLTGSRSGMIALCVLGLFVTLKSRYRFRLMFLGMVMVPIIWFSLPDDRQMRYLTLINPDYGPASAHTSAESRWVFFQIAIELWKQRPLIGYGPSGFMGASGAGLKVHSLYGQLISELGVLGILAFSGLLLALLLNAWEIHQHYRVLPPELRGFPYQLSKAVGAGFLLLLLLGCSGHNIFRYQWVWFGAFQALAVHCTRMGAAHAWRWTSMGQQPSYVSHGRQSMPYA